ncbi:MAG TPA: C-terminal binding protein [Chloroflexota bacterium]|nr:C-terminal binding protein [Chloroflexota bacterium]
MAYQVLLLDGPSGPGRVEEEILAKVGAEIVRPRPDHEGELERLVADADAILCDATPVTASMLDRARKVQIISEYGIGYDNIDVGAASQRGIWVSNVPGFCAEEVANHTMALILAASRRLLALDASTRAGGWDPIGVANGAVRLSTQRLGLVGFGHIGRRVAVRAVGFGLRVLAFSPNTTPELAREYGAERVDLSTIFESSDYVSLHLPSNPETRNLINAAALARFKSSAWLINTARGTVIDEAALLDALRGGRLAGAALDVRQAEPTPAPDEFRALPNVILTPHAAFYSEQSLLELRERAAGNVAAVLAGGVPNHPVNPSIQPRFDPSEGIPAMWV